MLYLAPGMRFKLTILLITLSSLSFGQGNGLYKFIGKNGKLGFIDKTGNVKVTPDFLAVNNFSEGLCFVSRQTNKWICIDTAGKQVFDIRNNFPETDFSEGFARISSYKEQWFVNRKGQNTFRNTWKAGQGSFKNGRAYVSDTIFTDFYTIDTTGRRTSLSTYSRIEVNKKLHTNPVTEKDTLVKFKQGDLYGFKNLSGKTVIQPKYYVSYKFKNGLCAVRLKYQSFEILGDYYFDAIINTKGEVVSEQEMHCYLGFQGDLIVYYGGAKFSGGVYYLDRNGQRVIPKE